MTRKDILYFINNKDLMKYDWYRELFSIPVNKDNIYYTYDVDTKIATFKDVELSVKIDETRLTPLLLSDTIKLEANDLPNLKTDMETTIGDIILNYILKVYPFNDKMPYTVNPSPIDIESVISIKLGGDISTIEYGNFVESCDFIEQLSDLFVTSATLKVISPAPGMMEYKKKLYADYRARYGDKLDTDIELLAEIDSKLVAYDEEYMKDDPTYGILVNKQIMTNARKNLFGTVGAEIGLDGELTTIVENSLLEGYPNNKEQLAAIFNSSRKGSIYRGFMTQFTGADAKVTARVINNIETTTGDCGTSNAIDTLLSKDNSNEYINYYIMVNGKPLLLDNNNITQFIDKVVKLRSYMTCIEPNNKYCGICSGKLGEDNKHLPIILTTENSSIFTNTAMKSMHDKSLSIVEYDLSVSIS